MTLILTCITPREIVQVSDTRLSFPDGSVHDDHAVKTTLLCGRHLLAYTGLACLGTERTDMVLASAAAKGDDIDQSLDAVRVEASRAIRASRATTKGLQILSAGWARRGDGPFEPLVVEMSNLTDGRWDKPVQPALTERGGFITFSRPFHLHVMGQPLPNPTGIWLMRTLRRSIEHGVGPRTIGYLMAAAIRTVAARNRMVGGNLLISSLPRDAMPADDIFTLDPNWTKGTFVYMTEEEQSGSYVPNSACGGQVFHAGVILWPSEDVPDLVPCPG